MIGSTFTFALHKISSIWHFIRIFGPSFRLQCLTSNLTCFFILYHNCIIMMLCYLPDIKFMCSLIFSIIYHFPTIIWEFGNLNWVKLMNLGKTLPSSWVNCFWKTSFRILTLLWYPINKITQYFHNAEQSVNYQIIISWNLFT